MTADDSPNEGQARHTAAITSRPRPRRPATLTHPAAFARSSGATGANRDASRRPAGQALFSELAGGSRSTASQHASTSVGRIAGGAGSRPAGAHRRHGARAAHLGEPAPGVA